jgi:hypothetical protein
MRAVLLVLLVVALAILLGVALVFRAQRPPRFAPRSSISPPNRTQRHAVGAVALKGLSAAPIVFGSLGFATAIDDIPPARQVDDVIISMPMKSGGRSRPANLYYNGRAVGSGPEALAEILARIRKLPVGTSIVWGPDYRRCGSCSGGELRYLAIERFPERWAELEAIVKERTLTLSSAYPGPYVRLTREHTEYPLLAVLRPEAEVDPQNYHVVLDWVAGERASIEPGEKTKELDALNSWSKLLHDGNVLGQWQYDLLLGQLPEESRVLLQIRMPEPPERARRPAPLPHMVEQLTFAWEHDVTRPIRAGRLRATVSAPPELIEAARTLRPNPPVAVEWRNYHGPDTPEDEVLCLIDGAYVGRGAPGFDGVLARLRALPEGTRVQLPRYEYSGRALSENYSAQKIRKMNAEVRELLPFPSRRGEWKELLESPRLEVQSVAVQPSWPSGSQETVKGWNSGDRHGRSLVRLGRIVRYDEQPSPPAAKLSWTNYVLPDGRDPGGKQGRALETTASYTLDDAVVGQGVEGFGAALDRIAALPPGSVVHVRVCLRTRGPFICPLIYEGQRHFERTGFEPYFGMFDWLIDVAEKRKLAIEWIPDERKSCQDCEMNR